MLSYLRSHASPILSLGVRALSVLAGFAVAFFIGREMGPAANGHYAVVTQTALMLAIFAAAGFDLAIVREYAPAGPAGKRIARRDLIVVVGFNLAVSAAIVLVLALAGDWLMRAIAGEALPRGSFALLALIFVTRLLSRVTAAFLRAQHRFVFSQCVEVLLIPVIVFAAVALHAAPSVEAILWWTAAAGAAAGLLGFGVAFAAASSAQEAYRRPLRQLLRTAAPLSGTVIALNFSDWYGLTTVAVMLGIADAGIYRIAMQVGAVLQIVTTGLYSVFAARISAAFAADDRPEVARLCRSAMQLALLLVVPAAVVLFFAAPHILGTIGGAFASGTVLIRIVAVAQALVALSGAAGVALAMSGHGALNLRINLAVLAAVIVLAPIAALLFGPAGVAACMALAAVGTAALNVWALRRISGIDPFRGRVAG